MHKMFYLFTGKLVTPILIALLLAALFYGLRPFSFISQNNVSWLEGQSGIFLNPPVKDRRLSYAGEVHTIDKINLVKDNYNTIPNLTLELWLKANSYYTYNMGSLLTMDDGKDPVAVFFGQWKSSLIIRIRDKTQNVGYKEIGLAEALIEDQESFITITSSKTGIKIYLNSVLKKSYQKIALIDSTMEAVQLISGVTISGKNRWRGQVYGLAVYGDTLSGGLVSEHLNYWQSRSYDQLTSANKPLLLYPFDEKQGNIIHNRISNLGHLSRPVHFQIIRKSFLGVLNGNVKVSRSLLKDILINIAGFTLLGFYLALWLKNRKTSNLIMVILVLVFCSLLSLGIEYAQVWLPRRDSSMLDFVLNSGGGLLGGVGVVVLERIKKAKGQGPKVVERRV